MSDRAEKIGFTIRAAAPGDEGVIRALLSEFAAFEKLEGIFRLTEDQVVRDLLGEDRVARCVLVFAEGQAVGVAVWFWTWRSFRAARGLFVEDLYVRPQARGRGMGTALLTHLAGMAQGEGAFLEWLVLDWNASAIAFYEKLGAMPVREWTRYRLDGDNLARLAS